MMGTLIVVMTKTVVTYTSMTYAFSTVLLNGEL